LKQLQLIQILSINVETLAELRFHVHRGRALTGVRRASRHEKGGIRVTEAALESGNTAVFPLLRFTAR